MILMMTRGWNPFGHCFSTSRNRGLGESGRAVLGGLACILELGRCGLAGRLLVSNCLELGWEVNKRLAIALLIALQFVASTSQILDSKTSVFPKLLLVSFSNRWGCLGHPWGTLETPGASPCPGVSFPGSALTACEVTKQWPQAVVSW